MNSPRVVSIPPGISGQVDQQGRPSHPSERARARQTFKPTAARLIYHKRLMVGDSRRENFGARGTATRAGVTKPSRTQPQLSRIVSGLR
jgi:hypothetical protein